MAVSQTFIDKEKSAERRPGELYHLWQTGIANKYYTSGDVAVVYDSNTYLPATIKRGQFQQTSNTEETKVTIEFNGIEDPLTDYIDQSMVDTVWVKIMKIHRDISPVEVNTTFVGRIKSLGFKGPNIQAQCSGIKGLYKKVIPKYRYQPTCNHALYSTMCTMVNTDFDYTGLVSALTADGLYLESAEIYALMAADGIDITNWCQYGYITFGNHKRMIALNSGNAFYLRHAIPDLAVDDSVTVYAGCDGLPTTCRDRFDNMINFLGFQEVPWDNPVTTAIP